MLFNLVQQMNIPENGDAITQWFSNCRLWISESPGKLKQVELQVRPPGNSDSVSLEWSPRMCILNKFPGAVDAAGSGHTL